ncbi:hypothetical protein TNCV_3775521 [Trichonephila clavipes]|nr:hypothetical protein TNCV_3775521 [Trichonephila clavipes]
MTLYAPSHRGVFGVYGMKHPETIAERVQAGGGSIMVLRLLSWHSLGSIVIVEGMMDQYNTADHGNGVGMAQHPSKHLREPN